MIGLNFVKTFYRITNKEKSKEILKDIENQIQSHIGKFALLKEKDGRNTCVYFMKIISLKEGESYIYDSRGNFQGSIKRYIDVIKILTDDQRLVFLDL